MRRWWLYLELLDDVVLSRRAATQGDHASLDRIPGSALRGWCAAHLYDALRERAWTVFHAGGVRWLDGLPADDQGLRSAPVPLSWHANKADAEAAPQRDGCWQAEHLFNLAAGAAEGAAQPGGFQPKGLRQGYVGSGGQALQPARRYRLMTAIAQDGQVAEGQLFGYECLAAGQRFVAALEVDDGVLDEDTTGRLLATLDGVIRLGRSRSAQYGRVRARATPAPAPALPAPPAAGAALHLLLVSDACLRDGHGHPSLAPDPATLDLAAGVEVDLARTYLRSRRYSGWNAYRGGPEMERQVLAAGGVITLRSPGGFDDGLLARLARGIGSERALGLGEVLVHPAWLRSPRPEFGPRPAAPAAAPGPAATGPDTPLLRALKQRAGTARHAENLQDVVEPALAALAARWRSVRRYLAVPARQPWGPGPSQWGALAQAGARAATLAELRAALLGASEGIVSRRLTAPQAPAKEFWDATMPADSGGVLSLAHWVDDTLQALGQAQTTDAARLDAWQRLCDTARRRQPHVDEAALGHLELSREAA